MLNFSAVSAFSLGGRTSTRALDPQTRRFRASSTNPATPNDSNADPKFLKVPSMGRTAAENDKIEEEAVDEYLEFLDRRYR